MRFMARTTDQIEDTLTRELSKKRGIKWYMSMKVKFQRMKDGAVQATTAYFTSECAIALQAGELYHYIQKAFMKMFNDFLEFQREGSDWKLQVIEHLKIHVVTYQPLKGSRTQT